MLPHRTLPAITRRDARALDLQASHRLCVSTRLLMENAGAGCAEHAWRLARRSARASERPTFAIFCGGGGNGGDGYVIARHLALAGFAVRVAACGNPRPGSDAADARAAWLALRVAACAGPPAVVVDAILGTGLARPAEGAMLRAIRRVNALRRAGARVLAIDIPSGVDPDTGAAIGEAVVADVTATIAARKVGLTLAASRSYRGRVVVVPFGAPGSLRASAPRTRG